MRITGLLATREAALWLRHLAIVTGAILVFATQGLAQDLKLLSSSLARRIEASHRETVAVADFTDLQGNVTELGRFLAEELQLALFEEAKTFRIIDRTHLKALLQEHQLAATGLIDPLTARQLGKIAGVDTLVTGTIVALGDNVRLAAKALDTTTAQMIAASTAEVPRTKTVEELLARDIENRASPSERNAGGAQQSRGNAEPRSPSRYQMTFKSITVSLDSLRVLTDNSVVVTLRFLAAGTKELLAALDRDSRNVYLTDDAGNRYGFKSSDSIGPASFINVQRGSIGWLTCPPGVDVTASVVFSPPRNMERRGSSFTVSIPAFVGTFYLDNFGYSRVTEDGGFHIYFRDVSVPLK